MRSLLLRIHVRRPNESNLRRFATSAARTCVDSIDDFNHSHQEHRRDRTEHRGARDCELKPLADGGLHSGASLGASLGVFRRGIPKATYETRASFVHVEA